MNCGTTHHEGCPCHEAAEVERLRGAIREHERFHPEYETPNGPSARNRRLWVQLEENRDER